MEETYYDWLRSRTRLKESSCEKYARAVNTIDEEMFSLGVLSKRVTACQNEHEGKREISKIFASEEFMDKDRRGNRMYSRALKYYAEFREWIL